jgi:hypothetical protein
MIKKMRIKGIGLWWGGTGAVKLPLDGSVSESVAVKLLMDGSIVSLVGVFNGGVVSVIFLI